MFFNIFFVSQGFRFTLSSLTLSPGFLVEIMVSAGLFALFGCLRYLLLFRWFQKGPEMY